MCLLAGMCVCVLYCTFRREENHLVAFASTVLLRFFKVIVGLYWFLFAQDLARELEEICDAFV